ncbi:type 2 periplasmic-binding domain-containing protein [Algoriphagus algorifonticola]|uniref:ABC transporter substrate-binding protein n=1 Tax=Algoriphagus algorifonticola TaxID=2593007 RepID=UPI0011A0B14B|nr:ABC transporter substrate-binding protein [Algoriphagus algorifonticola]
MKSLRITGVPEHFNLPWRRVIDKQPFLEEGVELIWIDESRGSGQMNQALRNDETDLALILTESFIQDFQKGNPSIMIGYHVKSPLIWGVHVGGKSSINQISDIQSPHFYISRPGSGSNLMALVLAERESWNAALLSFEVVGNLPGALEAYKKNADGIFLWEKFTTKPWVDSHELKRISEVPSPWPCFSIIASDNALKEFDNWIFKLRDLVYQESQYLKANPSQTISEISEKYSLKKEDVTLWFSQTDWAVTNEVNSDEMIKAMKKMLDLGIISEIPNTSEFLRVD